METTHTINGLHDPTLPPATTTKYQTSDKSRPTIRQVQGKIITEQGTKPNLMTAVHEEQILQLKEDGDNKQQQRLNVNTLRTIDIPSAIHGTPRK